MHIKRFVFDGHGALVATTSPGCKKSRVLFYAHADVMGATEEAFTLRQIDGKLFGRGVYDMKFAIAGYMQFVDTNQQNLQDYDFTIMITTDEEIGGRDNISSVPYLLELGYRADICIMPDGGSDWDIEYMAKGNWRFDLGASGKSAHSSRPWEGDSASFKLVHALHELRLEFKDHGPETDTLNIGKIHGGITYNQIPDQMIASIEIRLASNESYEKNKQIIDQLCGKYGLTCQTRGCTQPMRQDVHDPLLKAFMASITRITGHPSKLCMSMGGSDAKYFNELGIPCAITYLPGGGHHGDNEWIERQALLKFPLVIQDYIEENASTRASSSVDTKAALV